MRSLLIAAATATSLAGLLATSSTPAAAWDYSYCLRGSEAGYPGNCSFVSYGQCKATASGTNSYCDINPRYAFGGAASYGHGNQLWRAPWPY
ncbi:DUF3551 domain-containing protein [Rhodopseudomonas pseudopalustris]|uniref:DUF3551 domain-containing protein n=1 Tax=Rhodopseudomonas pseudopalustris TaxID=1513892 RepID=UPI003F9D9F94